MAADEMMDQLNEVDKFILLLLRANQEQPVPGALWLQKEIFLLQNIFPKLAEETDYDLYFLGPHSEVVEGEEEELHRSDLIKIDRGKRLLTKKGELLANQLTERASKKEIKKIEELKEFLNDLTKDELLGFVYFSYPSPKEIEKESIEYKDLLSKRKNIALSLYRKGKLSAQRAAQIAGMNIADFLKIIR